MKGSAYRQKRKDMISPCAHCSDKVPACSDHCDKPEYLDWKKLMDQKRAAEKAAAKNREDDALAAFQRYGGRRHYG